MKSNDSPNQVNQLLDSQKNWIKFLILIGTFILCFNYITIQLQYRNIFPLNYFESFQYASQVEDFLKDFYTSQIEIPQLKKPIEEIPVTKEEILDAKFDNNLYSRYLYDDTTGEYHPISSLTDEQITEIIRYHKYQENKDKVSQCTRNSLLREKQ